MRFAGGPAVDLDERLGRARAGGVDRGARDALPGTRLAVRGSTGGVVRQRAIWRARSSTALDGGDRPPSFRKADVRVARRR